jgi:hypothetical protein
MEKISIPTAREFNLDLMENLIERLRLGLVDNIEYSISGNNNERRMWVRVKYYPGIIGNIEGFNLTEISGRIRDSPSYFKLTRNGEGIAVEYNADEDLIKKIEVFLNQ